jgi:hypothetical protein
LTILVLLFLAGIWGVVLYGYFRDRLSEARPADSIGSFRRQLSVLERTGPFARRGPGPVVGGGAGPLAPLAPPARPAAVVAGVARTSMTTSASLAPVRRRGPSPSQRRRRDILFGLLAAMFGSLLLGFLPSLRVMWGLHLVLDCLFAAYVGLLIRRRNLLAEREMKLRFLPGSASVPSVPESALLLRRTGN